MHWPGDGISPYQMIPSLVVVGAGMGLAMAPFFNIVLAGVDDEETGSASGALTSVQQLGGAFGIAVLGTIFFDAVNGSDGTSRVAVFRDGAGTAMSLAAGFLAVAFALTFLLPERAREDLPVSTEAKMGP